MIRRLIYWAWSRKIDQIIITDEALKEAKTSTPKLIDEYSVNEVPLIHNATLGIVLRLACSFAVLTFSSPDGEKLEVHTKHVEMAVKLIREMVELWDLGGLKAALGKGEITEEERNKIEKILKESEVARKFLSEIAIKPERSGVLANKIGTTASYIRDIANELKGLGVVKSTPYGYALTMKGASVVRSMIFKSSK
ncbi:MAG: hypothetical protein H3Z51_06650 [archaeon]|nr:hypothetical protein [archaeon]